MTDYILEFLEKESEAPSPIDILGDKDYSLWALSAGLAEKRDRLLFRLPTELAAKLCPTFIRNGLLTHELLQQLIPIDRSGKTGATTSAAPVVLPFAHWTEVR